MLGYRKSEPKSDGGLPPDMLGWAASGRRRPLSRYARCSTACFRARCSGIWRTMRKLPTCSTKSGTCYRRFAEDRAKMRLRAARTVMASFSFDPRYSECGNAHMVQTNRSNRILRVLATQPKVLGRKPTLHRASTSPTSGTNGNSRDHMKSKLSTFHRHAAISPF